MHHFRQVDVFCREGFSGNPVAVILGADDLELGQMQAIARWTNLSETTFVQKPSEDEADYRIRIFTPQSELPFAGHPSVGTAHAVLEAGIVEPNASQLVQQCDAGLIRLEVVNANNERDIFVTSPEAKVKSCNQDAAAGLESVLALEFGRQENLLVIDVGPSWVTVELGDETTVRSLSPDMSGLAAWSRQQGVTGLTVFAMTADVDYRVCVRSFAPAAGIDEDPVCGSGNICVAAHLVHSGRLATVGPSYTASQGKEIGRNGRIVVKISDDSGAIAVGGQCVTRICGQIDIQTIE